MSSVHSWCETIEFCGVLMVRIDLKFALTLVENWLRAFETKAITGSKYHYLILSVIAISAMNTLIMTNRYYIDIPSKLKSYFRRKSTSFAFLFYESMRNCWNFFFREGSANLWPSMPYHNTGTRSRKILQLSYIHEYDTVSLIL